MAGYPHKHFERAYWVICAAMFAVVLLRCIFVPFAHDEVATFYYYIQPGKFLPFLSHPDANGHFLCSATSWVSFRLWGSSSAALRVPEMLAFLVLCYAVFRMGKLFSSLLARMVFSAAFIISFNFISFYSLCRGYGLSMALLVLALYYFFVYIRYSSPGHIAKFVLFSQLALSANLTLVMATGLLTGVLIVFQLSRKSFFKAGNILLLLLHFALLGFWICYGFYLKEAGALYYGTGESYWDVTFKSLIDTTILQSRTVYWLMIILSAMMLVKFVYLLIRDGIRSFFSNNFLLSFFLFCALVLIFYLLKKIAAINYPEDRTGLFFYAFFMTALAFMINNLWNSIQLVFFYIPLFFLFQLAVMFNIRVHPWRVYETMPQQFFDTLVEEYLHEGRPVTIAGHRVREFFYGFMNYNSPVKLNHMTAPEALQMNCDYALATKADQPWYHPYYYELAHDKYWDFTLLKRKTPLKRVQLAASSPGKFTGTGEYYNAFEAKDTIFGEINPLQGSFVLEFDSVPVPFNAWLVLQVDGEGDSGNLLVRAPLNLIKEDWNGTRNFSVDLVTGNVPLRIKRIVAYLWNIDKKHLQFTIHSFRLYRLEGAGVTEISKARL
jgi:hypothetical protein